MVFGIGEGKLEILLPDATFSPGQALSGKIILTLNQPTEARRLRVGFFGLARGRRSTSHIFSVTKELSGQRTYNAREEFDFSLIIPKDTLADVKVKSQLSKIPVLGQLDSLFGIRWYVEATLEMPLKLSIVKRLEVNIVGRQ